MPVYLIGYDLVKEKSGRDYQPLWDELERLGGLRAQYSLWLINVNYDPNEIANHFARFVDSNDRIWVTRLRPNEYTYRQAIGGTKKWLADNPPT